MPHTGLNAAINHPIAAGGLAAGTTLHAAYPAPDRSTDTVRAGTVGLLCVCR